MQTINLTTYNTRHLAYISLHMKFTKQIIQGFYSLKSRLTTTLTLLRNSSDHSTTTFPFELVSKPIKLLANNSIGALEIIHNSKET